MSLVDSIVQNSSLLTLTTSQTRDASEFASASFASSRAALVLALAMMISTIMNCTGMGRVLRARAIRISSVTGPWRAALSRARRSALSLPSLSLQFGRALVRSPSTTRHGYSQICALCGLALHTPFGYWQNWVKVEAETGIVLEDLGNTWISESKTFRFDDYSLDCMFVDVNTRSILWAYLCPACARSKSWWYGKYLD